MVADAGFLRATCYGVSASHSNSHGRKRRLDYTIPAGHAVAYGRFHPLDDNEACLCILYSLQFAYHSCVRLV